MWKQLFLLTIIFAQLSFGGEEKLKVLHLTFHKGCEKEMAGVAKKLDIDLTTWYIQELPKLFFDGVTTGNALYNMGHDRAERIYRLHKETFEKYDAIITSETTPLNRIFLQNNFQKPLIIWICNRFDYSDVESLDCHFPDQEYYDLFQNSTQNPNVTLLAFNPFEAYYARTKGVVIHPEVIKPCASGFAFQKRRVCLPLTTNPQEKFFLPSEHNETVFMPLQEFLSDMGIECYCGRYNSPWELADFKGIICLPNSWSNFVLFENLSLGIPHFLPSYSFMKKLMQKGKYYFANSNLLTERTSNMSEFYSPEYGDIFTYFDSWEDLKEKIDHADFPLLRAKTKAYALQHREKMFAKWEAVFSKVPRG